MLLLLVIVPCTVQDRDTAGRAAGGLACHFFNTFFLNKLYKDAGEYKYQDVSG